MAQNGNSALPATQKAAQYHSSENAIRVNTIPVPTPADDEILVKVACSSLCHSDVMLLEPNDAGLVLGDGSPITIGHEATGIIVSVPSSCTNPEIVVGAKVGFFCPTGCCYECEGCQVHNLFCSNGASVRMQGFAADGFFQEYVATPWRNAIALPESMDVCESAPLFCAGITAWHGVHAAKIEKGQWMAIIGCGGLGHLGIQYAKALGYKVIGIDLVDGQLDEAKSMGADAVFNPKTDSEYASKIKALTDGGCHAAVNFTASTAAYESTPAVLRINGVMVAVGIPNSPLSFQPMDVAMGKFRIVGASNGTPQQVKPCIEFSAKHGIKPHVSYYKIDQINEMIDILHKGEARGRLAVKWD
ncbi:hypothetical protein AJ80_02675 [Polytolypa hystricis UAMH7299]|uniref:Enoyl reductase (ER) domain-containing protein n=1 Tax=Polytolypa hystricis (strain UAMH7299) TaxID=1447883 RepID=A0A2B7YQE8_POLH7|nr:hypothetical protein AJ80_02675 [Polytolypa hystricis UAMH7299]